MAEDNKNFLTSLPGILTGIAAVIGAVTTLLVTLNNKKPDLPPAKPDSPASQRADPATDTTATVPLKPGAENATPQTRQPAEQSQNAVTHAIPPLRITNERLANQPQVFQVLHAFNLTAVIDDPDGFTYVRSIKSSTGQIVAKINKDERFYTYHQNDNWWQIKTAQGKVGYIHISRMKLLPQP